MASPLFFFYSSHKFEAFADNLTPEEILEQAQAAAKDAADTLTMRQPLTKVWYEATPHQGMVWGNPSPSYGMRQPLTKVWYEATPHQGMVWGSPSPRYGMRQPLTKV